MKYIYLIIMFLIAVTGYFIIEVPDPVYAAAHPDCYTVNASLDVEGNWPGGEIKLFCNGRQGGEEGSDGRCPGSGIQTISPGQNVTLEGCNCLKDDCVRVDESTLPQGCGLKDANYCGMSNARAHDKEIKVHCQGGEGGPGPGPGPGDEDDDGDDGRGDDDDEDTGRGGQCECSFEEQCTKNGKEGTRSCTGEMRDDKCQFSESCGANCSDCRVDEDETPENPENPENPNPPVEPPATPIPPINRCNQPCESDSYCEETTGDNCTRCLPSENGKTCQPPPGEPPRINTPAPTPRPTPRPTPTPLAYSPAMCKCDGIEPSLIVPGLTSKITAKAYVGGADTRVAKIEDVTFTLVEGNNTVGTVLQRSTKIKAATTSATANRVNYAATWDVNIPANLKAGSLYRIFATINCQKKQPTVAFGSFNNTAVLGTTDDQPEDEGVLAGISNWIQNIFGIRPKESVITPEELKRSAGNSPTPRPSSNDPKQELQLETVQPATLVTRGCTSITFQAK